MLIKIDVDSDQYKRIQNLINDRKYEDIHQFIKIAINNQIQEEQSSESENNEIQSESIGDRVQEIIQERQEELAKLLGAVPLEKSEIEPEHEELISNFYNRFFPVKLVVSTVARLMVQKKTWIELSEVQEDASKFAESVSAMLQDIEEMAKLPRNEKLSTGLPMTKAEYIGWKGGMRRKKEAKYQSSKVRFMEQFVGRPVGVHNFKGASFSMGLIGVKFVGDTCLVSLTDNGKEFALIENPIIDMKKYDYLFSDKEIKLIYKKIISRFPLEYKLVNSIIDKLTKEGSLRSSEIDPLFKEEESKIFKFYSSEPQKLSQKRKKDILVQARVGTMGRLSELRIVDWSIDKKGVSNYNINKDVLSVVNS